MLLSSFLPIDHAGLPLVADMVSYWPGPGELSPLAWSLALSVKRAAVPNGAIWPFLFVDKACRPTAPGMSFGPGPGLPGETATIAAVEERAVGYVAHGPVIA